jgi:hypothetical protein
MAFPVQAWVIITALERLLSVGSVGFIGKSYRAENPAAFKTKFGIEGNELCFYNADRHGLLTGIG